MPAKVKIPSQMIVADLNNATDPGIRTYNSLVINKTNRSLVHSTNAWICKAKTTTFKLDHVPISFSVSQNTRCSPSIGSRNSSLSEITRLKVLIEVPSFAITLIQSLIRGLLR